MRTHRCPYCKSPEVHRSRRRGALESLALRLLLLRPFRCWVCSRRHYGSILGGQRVSRIGPWTVPIGPVLRLFQTAALVLVLLGIPVVLANSGPVLQALSRLGFTGPAGSGRALPDQSPVSRAQTPVALAPQGAGLRASEPPLPIDALSANKASRGIEWSRFALASATPEEAVGELRTAGDVYLNESKVPALATVFPGDTLRTGLGGSATLEVPAKGTLLILEQTQISFGSGAGYFAELKQGAISLRSLGGVGNFDIQVGDFVVTPDPSGEAGAEIRRAADGSAQVNATQGSVGLISLRGSETVFISAGQGMEISADGKLVPAASPQQGSVAPQSVAKSIAKKKSQTRWIAAGVGGGGGAAAAVAAILASQGGSGPKPVSPSAP